MNKQKKSVTRVLQCPSVPQVNKLTAKEQELSPLQISMPLELKACPSTSPAHLGLCAIGWELVASKAVRVATPAQAGASTGVLRADSVRSISVLLASRPLGTEPDTDATAPSCSM